MSGGETTETFGLLLHGTARAWRQKLDQRLKPMGLSQAKWRTLMHLSLAGDALTQAEIAARLGVEEPSVVTLLHRLGTRRLDHSQQFSCGPPLQNGAARPARGARDRPD